MVCLCHVRALGGTLSHHDVVVLELQAVQHPGGGGEEGGHSQREGQTLQVAAAHYPHLAAWGRWRRWRKEEGNKERQKKGRTKRQEVSK